MAGNGQTAAIESDRAIVRNGSAALSGEWPLSGIGIQ